MPQHFYSPNPIAVALSAAMGTGDTTMQIAESATDNNWPVSQGYPFTLALDFGTVQVELVDVTGKGALAGGVRTWNVTRAQDGTIASTHAANVANSVRHVITPRDLREARQARYLQPDDTIATYIVTETTAGAQWNDTVVGDLVVKVVSGKGIRLGAGIANTGRSALSIDNNGITAGYVRPFGIPGAAANNFRLVGTVFGVPPAGGAFQVGDALYDQVYGGYWLCTVAGAPGTWIYPQPRGLVAWNERVTSTAGTTATTLSLATTVSVQLDSSRMYRIWTSPVLVQSTAAGDFAQIRLVLSTVGAAVTATSTLLALANAKCESAGVANTTLDSEVLLSGDITGAFQIGVAYMRNAGSGSVSLNLATGRTLVLAVEDVGPVVAKTP